jgi:hypothetical protein
MPKAFIQRVFRLLAWVLGISFFLMMLFFTRVDRKAYQESAYYKETFDRLDSIEIANKDDYVFLAGWSKHNVTPENPINLAGYRPRGKYEYVQDSSYIRAIVVQNGESIIAFINYELMIVPPNLKKNIKTRLDQLNIPIQHTYFTATHTHSGMGGFMPGAIGRFAFGGHNKELVKNLEEMTISALNVALSKLDTAKMIFQKHETNKLIANRLIEENPIDPFFRQVIFEKLNGEKAALMTYSAHPTILNRKFMGLSGDYPHYLSKAVEDSMDLALFAAGTVGSHKPIISGNSIEDVLDYSQALFTQVKRGPMISDTLSKGPISFHALPLALRKAHYRIGKNVRLRPWLFNLLVGNTNPHFDIVLLGNTLFISSSGEISGEFMKDWEDYARIKGLNLIITCFNGGYIGYITPDKYYDYNLYEVRDMNWYGPYNGAYFNEIITTIIDKTKK